MRRLAVTLDFLEERHREELLEVASKHGFDVRFAAMEPSLEDRSWMRDTEVLLTSSPRTISACGDGLRWVASSWAGVDAYRSLLPEGCLLTNNTGAYGPTISEHIIMLLLMLWRGEWSRMQTQMKGVWGPHLPQRSIEGATICVLGTGDIGTTFARKARALGAGRLIGVSRSGIARVEGVYDEMHPLGELETVLPEVDALVMSLPGTDETAGIIDARRIALLPSHAVLVNVGRGSAIVQDALVRALEDGTLGGAALDVCTPEPLPEDDPLWHAPNCLITPHVAGNMTLQITRDRTVTLFCEEFSRYARGETPLRVVDPALGY